jgi:hypothetical protein
MTPLQGLSAFTGYYFIKYYKVFKQVLMPLRAKAAFEAFMLFYASNLQGFRKPWRFFSAAGSLFLSFLHSRAKGLLGWLRSGNTPPASAAGNTANELYG